MFITSSEAPPIADASPATSANVVATSHRTPVNRMGASQRLQANVRLQVPLHPDTPSSLQLSLTFVRPLIRTTEAAAEHSAE